MGLLNIEEFVRKGQQIDLDMLNLDSAIKGIAKNSPANVPPADLMTWKGLYSDWEYFFRTNIKNPPILPFQSTSDLDLWLSRLESWRVKMQKWALSSGNDTSRAIASNLPSSPATIEHRENPPSVAGTPTWVYLGLGALLLGGLGYSLSAVARLGGK